MTPGFQDESKNHFNIGQPQGKLSDMSSQKEDLTPDEFNAVIRLYVLLDRIGRVDDFIWRGIDINEQKQEFRSLFGILPENEYERLFLSDQILNGNISFAHRENKLLNFLNQNGEVGKKRKKRKKKKHGEVYNSNRLTTLTLIEGSIPAEVEYIVDPDSTLGASITEESTSNEGSILPGDPTPIKGETILHRAMALLPAKKRQFAETDDEKKRKIENENTDLEEIIDFLFENVPFLVAYSRCEPEYSRCEPAYSRYEPEYDGQTPLHVAVMKENIGMVKKILEIITRLEKNPGKWRGPFKMKSLLNKRARGLSFRNTPMLAGTPICVAALTFNQEIFNYLIGMKCDITGVNQESDNVFHSLIKYAYCCNHLIDNVLKMMDYIVHCDWIEPKDGHNEDQQGQEDRVLGLWMTYNNKKKTPMQLSVKLGLHEIFNRIIGYKVYCLKSSGNDSTTWDITDIETAPKRFKPSNVTPTPNVSPSPMKQDNMAPTTHALREMSKQYGILRAIMKQKSPKTAYAFISCPPVRAVIDDKWKSYRWIFLFMGLCHFAFMCLLSASGIMRSKMYNKPYDNPDEKRTDPPRFIYSVAETPTLISMNILSGSFVLYALIGVILSVKGISKCNFNYPYSWLLRQVANPYSNSIFKLFAYLMIIFLLGDIVAAYTYETYEHQSLMFALIIGWYLELFFMQALKPLSFFAALIQKVVLDMIRFAFFIGILLVGFSSVMFMLMQGANTDDDAFDEFPLTILRMLQVMLGLGEIDALLEARHPAGASIVFVLFVLLTTILLLNALIAMMSNTCTELMSDRGRILATDYHYNLQKLSVVVFLETVLPKRWYKIVGIVKNRFWYKIENGDGKWFVAERLIWKQESTIDVDNGGVYEADDTLVAEVTFKALKHFFKKRV